MSHGKERQAVAQRVEDLVRRIEGLGELARGVALRVALETELVGAYLDGHREGQTAGFRLGSRLAKKQGPPPIPPHALTASQKPTPVQPVDWVDSRRKP